jgi:hypothetical protein
VTEWLAADSGHIIPLDDLREHECTPDCWRKPEQDSQEPSIYIHNSMDRREEYESGRLELH